MRTSLQLQRIGISGRGLVVALPYLWLMLFFVVPFVIVLKISFSDIDLAIPPYKPLLEWAGKNSLAIRLNFNNYVFLFTDSLYLRAFGNSIKVAFISTLLCLVIGYPMAYGIARARAATRNVLLLLVILPEALRSVGDFRMIAIGSIMFFSILLLPKGLLGEASALSLLRRQFGEAWSGRPGPPVGWR